MESEESLKNERGMAKRINMYYAQVQIPMINVINMY